MKTQLSLVTIVALFVAASWISPVDTQKSISGISLKKQNSFAPDFSFFRTHRQGRGVTATWGLSSNGSVTGFVVQRTYEDPNDQYASWDNICAMPCGPGKSFKHEDESVSPGFISYRVIAYLQYGGSVMSMISTEHVVSH